MEKYSMYSNFAKDIEDLVTANQLCCHISVVCLSFNIKYK